MKLQKLSLVAGAIVLSLGVIPFAPAQANVNNSVVIARAKGQGKLERLNLTEAQKTQIEAIKKDARAQMQEILTDEQLEKLQSAKGNRQQKREIWGSLGLTDTQKAKLKEIRQSKRSQIKAILTDEQKQQLQQMRQNRRQNRRQQGAAGW